MSTKMVARALSVMLFVAGLSPATNFDSPLEMWKAPTWHERQKALHAVLQKYALSDADLQTGIVKLFTRETEDARWEEEAELDDFNKYYQEISQLCQKSAQTYHREDAWRTLVFSAYNPTSEYGRWLVSQPESFPFFLEMSRSSNQGLAGQGLQMLGQVLELCQGSPAGKCSPEVARQRNDILRAIRKQAVSESDDAGDAIIALGYCGRTSDIELLESRASALRAERIDPSDAKRVNDRQALLWLIRESEKQIRMHLTNNQRAQ